MDKSPFIIARTFAAPRERVWQAWTEAAELEQWWGPKGFVVRVAGLHLRPGGRFHYCLTGPGGVTLWGLFQFRELRAPERLVFLNSFADAHGAVTRAPFNEQWPLQMLSTIVFTAREDGTTVTIQWEPWEATAAEWQTFAAGHESMTQGWNGTFDQLAAHLARSH